MTGTVQPPDSLPATGADRPRILVVEDDEALARLMEALLESAGYAVSAVPDGERALDLIGDDPPALVLLDLTLPTIDGWEVLDRTRAIAGAPPVILLTGHEAALVRAREAGAAAAVLKPFDVDELLEAVERLIVRDEG